MPGTNEQADAGLAPTAERERPLRVLIVEDSEDDALLLVRELKRGGYRPEWRRVETAATMESALREREWDAIIADYALPQFSGLDALAISKESGTDLPFIIVSGTIGEDVAVAAMKAGAHDFMAKGNLARLLPAIERELREAESRRRRRQAETEREEEAAISNALVRVGRRMISSLDTPELLEGLCYVTAEVLACDRAYTFLRQGPEGAYRLMAACGDSPEERETMNVLEFPVAVMTPLLAPLRENGVVEGGIDTGDPVSAYLCGPCDLHAVLYVGLERGGEQFGIHAAGFTKSSARLGRREYRIASGLAQLASLGLDNARLFEELGRANRLKSDFVATMSHELRTPLHIVMGYNEILREQTFGEINDKQRQTLDRMHRSARQLLSLVDATLDLSRLDAGRMGVRWSDVDATDLLEEITAETKTLQEKAEVSFICKGPERACPLRTDHVKLKVILQNLLDNAFKFTEQGSVSLRAEPCEGGVEFSVSDTGIGIPDDIRDVIFEPFRQGDGSDTRRYGGVGLGLNVARRLLKLLHGRISVESVVGDGSCFRVWIPRRPPSEDGAKENTAT